MTFQKMMVNLSFHIVVCAEERHHRVSRRYVAPRQNTTNMEQGLAEDIILHTLRDLRSEPLRDGFVAPHKPTMLMLRTLIHRFDCSGNDVQTCSEARSGAVRLHRGDVCTFTDASDQHMYAGQICFFASSREWGECAFVTAWARLGGSTNDAFWRFQISDDLVRVPVEHLMCSCTAFIGDSTAQVVCPPIVFCM